MWEVSEAYFPGAHTMVSEGKASLSHPVKQLPAPPATAPLFVGMSPPFPSKPAYTHSTLSGCSPLEEGSRTPA